MSKKISVLPNIYFYETPFYSLSSSLLCNLLIAIIPNFYTRININLNNINRNMKRKAKIGHVTEVETDTRHLIRR